MKLGSWHVRVACERQQTLLLCTTDRCWIAADTLSPAMQAELIQASGKHKAKADESKDLAELTGTTYQLSKGVKSGGASDDLCNALEALHIDPGQQPSKSSVEAANTWFSLEDDQETAEAIAVDLQADILSDCNEDSVDENNGGEDSGDSGCEDKSENQRRS